MSRHEGHPGARYRTLMFIYIAWLTLSLAPGMIAPPERTFDKGQAEMEQSMDNMVTRQMVIQKRIHISQRDKAQHFLMKRSNIPEDKDKDNKAKNFEEVNFKTSKLLAEAEKVLKTLPASKERQWVESFVERMREIAKMIETTTQRKSLEIDVGPTKRSPVPDDLAKRSTLLATSAVPDVNPFQKPNGISKIQMTSPEINRVLPEDDQSEHQAVTKPVALSHKVEETESDELVRELESLHLENPHRVASEASKAVNEARTTAIPSTPLPSEDNNQTEYVTENSKRARTEKAKLISKNSKRARTEKAKLISKQTEKARTEEAKLINELEEFHRRGGTLPKSIVDTLYADSQKTTGSPQNRKPNRDEAMKFTEAGMKDRRGIMRVDDLNNEDRQLSMGSMRSMPPYVTHQFPYMRENNTFPTRHPNMVQEYPRQIRRYYQNIPPAYKAQPYQGYPLNLNPNMQKMAPYNQGKYYDSDMLHQPGRNPAVFNQMLPRPPFYYNGRLPPYNYPNYFMRPIYGPYPYVPHVNPQNPQNPQNSTIHLPQMMQPYAMNQPKIDTQLSDDMKRQLRDGKIIVLSDSVVRSNFQATETTTGKPDSKPQDVKNETVREN